MWKSRDKNTQRFNLISLNCFSDFNKTYCQALNYKIGQSLVICKSKNYCCMLRYCYVKKCSRRNLLCNWRNTLKMWFSWIMMSKWLLLLSALIIFKGISIPFDKLKGLNTLYFAKIDKKKIIIPIFKYFLKLNLAFRSKF